MGGLGCIPARFTAAAVVAAPTAEHRRPALVQLAGEQEDAVQTSVVAEPVAGHAHLAATAGEQDLFVEVGLNVDGDLAGSRNATHGPGWNAGRGHSRCLAEAHLYQ